VGSEHLGHVKGADGFFANPPSFGGGTFHFEAWCSGGAAWERENAIVVDNLGVGKIGPNNCMPKER